MKLKGGDVFTIPLSGDFVGIGQIVYYPDRNKFMIVVYKRRFISNDITSFDKLINEEILLMGYTLDAKLYHKHWTIIGNEEIPQNIKWPIYKLGSPPGEIFLTDYKEQVIRRCKLSEFDNYNYLTVVAPVRYENALKAYHDIIEWQENFNKLLYSPDSTSF